MTFKNIENWLQLLSAALVVCCSAGCSDRPSGTATSGVNAEAATRSALELFDKDADGTLNEEELKASPPLVDALPAYDTNQDGSLAQAELIAGIESWTDRGIGATVLPFSVKMDGRPLKGAQVRITPAPFLGTSIQPAAGISDLSGSGSLEVAPENRPANFPTNLPVVQSGLYLVEITHPTVAVPAAYNKASILGLEAAVAAQKPGGVVWELSSKKK
jgi:hypothetical protein